MKKWQTYITSPLRMAHIIKKKRPDYPNIRKDIQNMRENEGFHLQMLHRFSFESMKRGDRSSYEVAIMEANWLARGRLTVYLDSPELVKHLDRLKVSADYEALNMFPHESFSLAVPRGSMIGDGKIPLIPCLVEFSYPEDDAQILGKYSARVRFPIDVQTVGKGNVRHFRVTCPSVEEEATLYNTVPEKELVGYLEGDTKAPALPSYDAEGNPLAMEEYEVQQMRALNLFVTKMMLYCVACPERLREGYPQDNTHKTLELSLDERKHRPLSLEPPPVPKGYHGSPCEHWRSSHLRTYPRRKDGTKQPGLVEVQGTMVNRGGKAKTVVGEEP